MTDAPPAAGLVLAAGTSSRLPGGSKLLLPYAGGPLVAAPVRAALEAGLAPVLVVLGHRAREVREALAVALGPGEVAATGDAGGTAGAGGGRVRFVTVADPGRGQGASLAAGVAALARDPSVAAAAVLLGDEPGISPGAVRRVVSEWRPKGPALRARYRDRPGHPVVFGRGAFGVLAGLEGDRGASVLFGRDLGPVREVELDRDAPVDVDTPGDYRRALAAAGPEAQG